MLITKLYTKDYKHEYWFTFKGEKYRVHSIVKLTEEARWYFGSNSREVILTEEFVNQKGVRCWKYEYRTLGPNCHITNAVTNRTPDELIEEVVIPAKDEYASREIFGTLSPNYTTGEKHTPKDWEIPEVRNGWIILILIFIGVAIFKDWYVQLIIRIAAGWIFGLYRQAYVNAYTTYEHPEDLNILKKKYEVLYGIKQKEEDKHE